MSNEACRKILTEHGFSGDEVDDIINDLPNVESINQYTKELKGKITRKESLKRSRDISKQRTIESIKSIQESLIDNPKPFKTVWNLLVGKNGLWINAQARSEMRNARVLKEMSLTNREMSSLLDDKEGFVKDLIEELELRDEFKTQ